MARNRKRGDGISQCLSCLLLQPVFFMILGCAFIVASYTLLAKVGPCGERLIEMSCLELSRLRLAFGLLAALLGVGLLIYGTALHATHQGQINGVKEVYDQIKLFFASPLFYILYGTILIYCGLVLLDETHASFVYILAVLGITMILYGTGSQAFISGDLPQQNAGKLSVGIAGGAAALAAIFGFGIVYLEKGIQDFFKRTVDYGFLELTVSETANQTLDLEEQTITASTADGKPLHFWKQTSRMQILVPRYSRKGSSTVVVNIKGQRFPVNHPPVKYTVNWESVLPLSTSGNEMIYISQQNIALPPAPTLTVQVDESGRPLPSITMPPAQ